jgi:hypothetical protein
MAAAGTGTVRAEREQADVVAVVALQLEPVVSPPHPHAERLG